MILTTRIGMLIFVLAIVGQACSSTSEPPTTTHQPTNVPPSSTTTISVTPTTSAATTTTASEAVPCDGRSVAEGDLGDIRTDDCGIEQVFVPAGTFIMGTENPDELTPPEWAVRELASETPAHEVDITTGYWIDRFEVTNAAFDRFITGGGYEDQAYWTDDGWAWLTKQRGAVPADCGGSPDEPRVCVTWHEAVAYSTWRGGRLPTEAEWEFAARGPDSLVYPWGQEWDPSLANVVHSVGLTVVGSYPDGVSWVGAFDMSGNAMEWVSDYFSLDYYEQQVRTDPKGPEEGIRKVEKGGWWGSNPYVARAAYRHFEDPPRYQDHHIGFRVLTPIG